MPAAERKKTDKMTAGKVFYLLPGIILVTIWPLLMHRDTVRTWLENVPWYPDRAYASDFFLHIKSRVFLMLAVWMLTAVIVCLVRLHREKAPVMSGRGKGMLVLTGLYLFLTVLSGLLSPHRFFSFAGFTESYETVPVIIGYGITFLYAMFILKEDRVREILSSFFILGAGLMGALGTGQMLGWDFWLSLPGRWLIYGPAAAREIQSAGETGMTAGRKVYLSMYNPNYAAVYLLIVLPLCIAILYRDIQRTRRGKRDMVKMVWDVLTVAMLMISLFGTGSKTAWPAAAILCIMTVCLWQCSWRRKCGVLLALGVLAAISTGTASFLSGQNIIGGVLKNAFPRKMNYRLKTVELNHDRINIIYREKTYQLQILRDGNKAALQVLDADGQLTKLPKALGIETFRDEQDLHVIMIHRNNPWHFVMREDDGIFHFINMAGREDVPVRAEPVFGKGYERAFTNRMYIWGLTARYLPGALLTGYGPESFAFIFPQNDYVMKSNLGQTAFSQAISRPHSLFLQIWMNSGALALVCMLALIGLFGGRMLECRRVSWGPFVFSAFLSVTAFLLMGLLNDSMVAVTPLICLIAGMGMAAAGDM